MLCGVVPTLPKDTEKRKAEAGETPNVPSASFGGGIRRSFPICAAAPKESEARERKIPKTGEKTFPKPYKKFISLNEIIISLNEIIISLNEMAISFNETNFFCGLGELLPRGFGTFSAQ